MFDQLSIVLKSYYFFVKIKTHHETGFNKETSSSSLESILGFRNLHKTKGGEEVRAIYWSRYSRMEQVEFLEDSLQKILLDPFLNTLTLTAL